MLRKALAGTLISLVLAGCATNAITGKSQLNLVSEKRAEELGAQSYSKIVAEYRRKGDLIEEGPLVDRVTLISNRLIDQAVKVYPAASEWNWQVRVVKEDSLNAWCMPGGKMAVYTGLVEKLDLNDDELAAVMGHEISHALAGHGREKMSMQMMSGLAVAIIAAAASNNNAQRRNDYQTVGGALASMAVLLPNSRETEYEADRIGVELATRAGYDPKAAVEVWKKMDRHGAGKGSDFLSTHPSGAKRIQELENLQALMQPVHEKALQEKVSQTAPSPWISNEANRYAIFSKERYMASVSQERLVTYNYQNVEHSTGSTGNSIVHTAAANVGAVAQGIGGAGSGAGAMALQQGSDSAPQTQPSAKQEPKLEETSVKLSATELAELKAQTKLELTKYEQFKDPYSIKHQSLKKIQLSCESNCPELTVNNAEKLKWAITHDKWDNVEQTVERMNVKSNSGYYWLGIAAWERGAPELAEYYLDFSIKHSHSASYLCDNTSAMPCLIEHIEEHAQERLSALRAFKQANQIKISEYKGAK